jgi:hypothetical protein
VITRALAACAAALALAAAFYLVIVPATGDVPATGAASPAAANAGATDPAARSGVADPRAAADDIRAMTSPPKNSARPDPYLVQTKVAKKRGRSYLVLDVTSRTGSDATLVVKQRICRESASRRALRLMDAAETPAAVARAVCSTVSTTVRVNARWTVSVRRHLGAGRFHRGGAPSWSVKRSATPGPAPTVTVTALRPAGTVAATTTVTAAPGPLCGAPANPLGLHYCAQGALVLDPPGDICAYFACIPNFPEGRGYVVVCQDGMISRSGGVQGACSQHGGVRTEVRQTV